MLINMSEVERNCSISRATSKCLGEVEASSSGHAKDLPQLYNGKLSSARQFSLTFSSELLRLPLKHNRLDQFSLRTNEE